MSALLDWLLAAGVMIGIFLLAYMAYRQQGLLDTFREIKEMFKDRADEAKEVIAYR